MALEARLIQKLSQNLLMTPQLRQAIELLQLGRLEYLDAIQKELLENPLLEELKEDGRNQEQQTVASDGSASGSGESAAGSSDGDAAPGAEAPELVDSQFKNQEQNEKVDWEGYADNFSDYSGAAAARSTSENDDYSPIDATATRSESLSEHLLGQIRMAEIEHRDREIAMHIVGNLDRNGYLCSTYEELASEGNCDVADIERVISIVQSFDPPGVGARDLRECLVLQLDSQGLGESLEARIVQNHLDKLERRRFDLIAKAEQVAVEQVYQAVNAIKKLEPWPGRPFAEDPTRYVQPDIYVQKVGEDYVITLNEEGLPRLRINPYYMQLLKDGGDESLPNRTYLNERLKAASWLIRSIMQRQQTIYRVTESIVKFQRAFLDHGVSKLRPLVLKDVAEDIGMHESTVSRVTTNKYVHTPQGVFELKYFFTTGIKTGAGDVSSSSVKEKIRNLIANEDSSDPISDQGIVELLKKENIDIARRTVAKYRESLGIDSSSRRKKLF